MTFSMQNTLLFQFLGKIIDRETLVAVERAVVQRESDRHSEAHQVVNNFVSILSIRPKLAIFEL